MGWLRAFWTQLWITLVVTVVVVALYTSLGRQLVPLLETWQPDAEQWLSELLGQPVRMQRMQGGWDLLSPVVTITGLEIAGTDGIRIDLLEAELDVSASLFWRQPVLRRIEVHGVRLHLQQHQERQWQLAPDWIITLPEAGASSSEPAAERSGQPAWLSWLELQQAIILRDWQLTGTDLHGAHDEIRIEHLLWRNQGQHRELNGYVVWGQEELAGIRLMGSLRGPLWPWDEQQGDIYLEVDEQEWTRWIPDELPAGLQVVQLRAGAKGWLRVRNGDLQALYLDAQVAALHLNTQGEPLHINDGQFRIAGQHNGSDWHIRLRPDVRGAIPFGSLTLSAITLPQQKGWQVGIPRADVQELRSFLVRHAFLPGNIAPYIEHTGAQGLASDVRVSLLPPAAKGPWQVDVRARLDEISTLPYRGIPAFTGLSADLHLQPQAGSLRVRNDEMTLHLADLYEAPWALEGVSGTFRWFLHPDHSTLQVQQLRAALQHSPASQPGVTAWPLAAELQLVLPNTGSPVEPALSLLLGLPRAPISLHEELVPELVGDELQDWLMSALQQGDVRDASFALQTLAGSHHPDNSTSLKLYLEFLQARLNYLPDWPAVTRLQGRLLLDSPALDVWLEQGQTLGGQLQPNSGRVRLRPLSTGGSELEVSARLQGDSREALQYFTATPLQDVVGDAFADWQASGPLQASLLLRLPLTDGDDAVDIRLEAALRQNHLSPAGLNLDIRELNGNLRYSTREGLSSDSLTGRILGGSFTASLRSEMPTPEALNIYLDGRGDAQWQDFREWLPFFLLDPFSGQLQYQAQLQLTNAGVQFTLGSDLQGTTIDLPFPAGKRADEQRPLQVTLNPADDGLRMRFRFDDWLRADLLVDDGDVQRGHIRLGGLPARLPQEPGLVVSGQFASELIAEDWWDSWQRLMAAAASAAPANATATGNASAGGGPVSRIELTLGQVQAWGMPTGVTEISARQTPQSWDINLDSTLLRGLVQLPHDGSPLQLNLEYLHLPQTEPASVTLADAAAVPEDEPKAESVVSDPLQDTDPASFPAMDVTLAEVFAGGRHLGRWQFSARPDQHGVQVTITDSSLHGLRIRGGLNWQRHEGMHYTELQNWTLNSRNVGQIQRGFRLVPVIEGRDLEGSANLIWPGSPLAFSAALAEGDMSLRIRNGTVATDGTGALRAFGAFNINSMSRRLKLDFSDLYQSGVAFDTLRGSARLQDGVLTLTEPLVVDGPGGRFQTSGSTNLRDESLDMKLAVTLPVTSSLPMVAVLAGFAPPVAASIYVTEKLIGDELSRFTSTSYDIRGTWQEPDMKINRAFDNKVDGSQRRSFRQRFLSIFGMGKDK